jgi:hypothetical protein
LDQRWRKEWLAPYLQTIAKAYSSHPALLGYYLDDTFAIDSAVTSLRLDPSLKPTHEITAWGELLHRKLRDGKNRELVFSDFHTIIDEKLKILGITWDHLTPHFDRIMVYNINISESGLIEKRLKLLKAATGSRVPLSWGLFTFEIGQARNHKALQPTVEEFQRQIDEIVSSGSSIDFYAFRVGDWTLPFAKLQDPLLGPENAAALLRYRPELHEIVRRASQSSADRLPNQL